MHPLLIRVSAAAQRPTEIAPLIWLRILFGSVMAWEALRYISHGWVEAYYLKPEFRFSFLGFDWVEPLPGCGLHLVFASLVGIGIAVAIGAWYRVSASLLFLGWTYIFLLERAHYLNHLYLACLIAAALPLLPAHQAFSVDVVRKKVEGVDSMPSWILWALRGQVAIVYLFGGIAKLNADWLQGQPMLQWMENQRDRAVLGPFLAWDPTAVFLSHGGLLFDLLIVPALLFRPTRTVALLLALIFHGINAIIFKIGIFPFLGFGLTLLFLEPKTLRSIVAKAGMGRPCKGRAPVPAPLLFVFAAFFAVQIGMPLRHWLYPGPAAWTEEGHLFAWRMKLRQKRAKVSYEIRDPSTGRRWIEDPRSYLTKRQYRKMRIRPDMIVEFGQWLGRKYKAWGHGEVQVHAVTRASLHGRPFQALIVQERDLMTIERRVWPPADWIVPLERGPVDGSDALGRDGARVASSS